MQAFIPLLDCPIEYAPRLPPGGVVAQWGSLSWCFAAATVARRTANHARDKQVTHVRVLDVILIQFDTVVCTLAEVITASCSVKLIGLGDSGCRE